MTKIVQVANKKTNLTQLIDLGNLSPKTAN